MQGTTGHQGKLSQLAVAALLLLTAALERGGPSKIRIRTPMTYWQIPASADLKRMKKKTRSQRKITHGRYGTKNAGEQNQIIENVFTEQIADPSTGAKCM